MAFPRPTIRGYCLLGRNGNGSGNGARIIAYFCFLRALRSRIAEEPSVPMFNRFATEFKLMVLSCRNRRASATSALARPAHSVHKQIPGWEPLYLSEPPIFRRVASRLMTSRTISASIRKLVLKSFCMTCGRFRNNKAHRAPNTSARLRRSSSSISRV